RLQEAAQANATLVVMGMNERAAPAAGTVYNTQLTLNEQGEIVNHHRKLIPTHTERIAWAHGDAHGLGTIPKSRGQLGGLISWEHWNPVARYAPHAEHEQIH